jgi:hypothetical protein
MRVVPTVVLFIVTVAATGRAQVPASAPIDWSAEDSTRVAFLLAHGRAYTRPPVIVWAPIDSLDPGWLAPFIDSLAAGVTGLKALIGGPFTWQRLGSRPVRFYLSPGRFVSHADGRDGVFISLNRVRRREGPFLHEAAHELLAPPPPFYPFEYPDSLAGERAAAEFPFWLSEGLPDYLAQMTADTTGFPEGDVFAIGGLAKVDSVCTARLGSSRRQAEILARVGRPGRLEALFSTDRAEVAPVYYACSQSFTKHLVARLGLPAVVALVPRIPAGTWRTALESAATEPLERLRRAWLVALGLTSTAGAQQADVMVPVRQFVDAFNKGDTLTVAAVCAAQTSIIDEFPPYEWHDAGACSTWMSDYDTKKGKPEKEISSIFTFALEKSDAGWRITGWAWAKN